MLRFFSLIIILIVFPTLSMSQSNQQPSDDGRGQLFSLDDLIPGGSTFYAHSVPENMYVEWWGDECIRLDMESCSLIHKETGKSSELFTLQTINAALRKKNLATVRHLYTVSFPYPERTEVLVQLPRHRVLIDWTIGQVVWSQRTVDDDSLTTAEDWNKESKNLAYVINHNLFVTDASGHLTAVSHHGCLDVTYGESVHRDEFGITKGTFWSNDGTKLAFYRMDQSMVSTYPQVNISPFTMKSDARSSRCAVMEPDKYPMAGETSHQVNVGIFDVASKKTVYLDLGDVTDRYFTNISWSPDNSRLYLIELNRDQTDAKLDAYDVETGKYICTLLEEHNERYVEPLHPIVFLPWDSSRFIYQTRNRDGYNHLFVCRLSKDGKAVIERNLTPGNYEVIELIGFNKDRRSVIFTSNQWDPIGCCVNTVDMKGNTRIISSKQGWHHAQLSYSGRFFSDNWSWAGKPDCGRIFSIFDTDVRKSNGVPLFEQTFAEPWNNFLVPEIKVGTIKAADGVTDLYYRLILPTHFDASKSYPVIIYVYGGPHAHNIDASRHWGVRGWDIWMAQNGYIMFCLDNRGSEHRGLDFEQATFRHLGVEEMKDQMCGVQFLKSLPYVDANRIGVHGWSFGGFMTTSLMTTYPDVFKVGVAGGPVIDWKYYEVMYGERYMDTPQANPEGYQQTSLLEKAGKLKGRLLIIYGGNDPTCVPQHTLSFIRACIDQGTHPDLFTYPGDGHNMTGTDRVHLHEHITRYFQDYLR